MSISSIVANLMAGGLLSRILLVVGSILLYIVLLVVYRLYFSPLSKFPGPKLAVEMALILTCAAMTALYAFYYDCVEKGQYIWKIEEMHKKYGPIIRIRPDVLHVNDPDFIDQLYTGASKRRHKYKIACNGFANRGAALGTMDHDLHRSRRAALNPFFSKQSVRRLEPIIQEALGKVLDLLSQHAKTGSPVTISLLYSALTSDIINNYAFGPSESSLERPDLNEPTFRAFLEAGEAYHTTSYFPFLPKLNSRLPLPIVKFLFPKITVFIDLIARLRRTIAQIRSEKGDSDAAPTTVFHRLISGDLPESEKTDERMISEARVLLAAGTDTTARALTVITYHLLADPERLKILKDELEVALPDPNNQPSCAQVETLPYLNAVIQEGLRLHPPASIRQERVAPDEDLYYEDKKTGKKYVIPKGIPVGMTAPILSRNPAIYPSPTDFRPERFIENPRLDRYSLTFSRGTRRCLGMTLAYQELQIVLACIFRKYGVYDGRVEGPTLELYHTTREGDVEMAADFVASTVRAESKGVRLMVR